MIKLIACDMDGTLLDSRKRLPPDLPRVLAALDAQGTIFAVASGRQYAVLRRDFERYAGSMLFICENGALVMHKEKRLLIDPMDKAMLRDVILSMRDMPGVYPVVCRADVALIDRKASREFVKNTCMYYPSVQVVDDLLDHLDLDDVCKVAFYDEQDAQTHELPALQAALADHLAVILSGEHWVDVMKPGVNKGKAMRAIQMQMGIAPQECMAFGDYLNDVELLEAVEESYAMANAHPTLFAASRHTAPSNDEDGVMRVIRSRVLHESEEVVPRE